MVGDTEEVLGSLSSFVRNSFCALVMIQAANLWSCLGWE
jgi:hypothetical protein